MSGDMAEKEDDPLAWMRARYVRHERLPIPTFVNAAKGAGCTVSASRMRGVNFEVNYGGMCVGTISVEGQMPVLEMSKVETPASELASVDRNVTRYRQQLQAQAQIGAGRNFG